MNDLYNKIIGKSNDDYDLLFWKNDSDSDFFEEKNYYEKKILQESIFNQKYLSNSDKKTREMTNVLKKKGRIKVKPNTKEEHTKFSMDNRIAKNLVNFHQFLIDLSNGYLNSKKIKDIFFPISGDFTKKRDLSFLKMLLNYSLKEVLQQKVSGKYGNLNHNKDLMDYLEKNYELSNEFKKFFDVKYKDIYSEIFLNNNMKKLKDEFGIECKLKMYEDFILKLEKKYEQKYIDSMKNCCENFITYIEFTTPKKKQKC